MNSRFLLPFLVIQAALLSSAQGAFAWTPALEQSLYRDAQKLLPRSLAMLMQDRESAVLDAAQRPPQGLSGFRDELAAGALKPETLSAFDAELRGATDMMQHRQLGAGLVRMGAVLRVAADVCDPTLAQQGTLPPAVTSEYYAFLETNLDKIPVVVDDPKALEIARADLPAYWQSLLERSRGDVPVILGEMLLRGRVVRHQAIDYRSPVFGVGSLAYSRAVTGIAATWLAAWRSVRGDMGQIRKPRTVAPPISGSFDTDTLERYKATPKPWLEQISEKAQESK
jgi:hypothetical protein